jgi:hypothetical protein
MIHAINRKDHKKKRHAIPGLKIHEIYDEHGKARPTPCIDQEIRSLLNTGLAQPRWSEDGALAFGKRTLEVAAHEANAELAKNTGNDIENWARYHDLASDAATGIDTAVEHILGAYTDAPNSSSRTAIIGLLVSPLGRIYKMKADRLGEKLPIPQRREWAEKDAAALYDAAAILHLIADETLIKRNAIAGQYHNPGRPEKVVFAKLMMEAWIFLTGKRPNEKNSQFVSFVEAGWFDLSGGEESSWDQPIRKAHKGFSPQNIAAIADRGPSWE